MGKDSFTAELLENKAPRTCEAILNALPMESVLHTAKIAGKEIVFMIPVIVDESENPSSAQEPGNVSYWAGRQSVCIFWGKLPGIGPVSVFGRVTEGLDALSEVGRRTTLKQGEKIVLKKKE